MGVKSISHNFDALRCHHFQMASCCVLVVFTSSLLMPQRRRWDTPTLDVMAHLASFAANFGAQCWVTFVAGLTMFYSLPRHMFGRVQSRLFPMFFLWSLACAAVTMTTFLSQHPVDTWDYSRAVQGCMLTLAILSAAANSLFVSPVIVASMSQTFKMEVDAGNADVVGYADMKELKKTPSYLASYKMFRRCHGISAMLVVTSLVANTVHLYFMASLCSHL